MSLTGTQALGAGLDTCSNPSRRLLPHLFKKCDFYFYFLTLGVLFVNG